MPIQELKSRIDRLPEQPGVYLFANEAGETIYVGKARSLRDRVRSYLGARGTNAKTDALLDEASGVEVIVTDSVVEALALENNLIKQRMPRFNILLRDDKNYPFLQLSVSEEYPRVRVVRGVERDGNVYAGPFMPASLARRTMGLTHRLFGIRSCNEELNGRRPRPCLEYDIKRCLAPCVASICPSDQYRRAVEDAQLFLEGRTDELAAHLRERMTRAAMEERFEQAAQLRDAMHTVETLRDRQQKMAGVELGDRDVWGAKVGAAGAAIQVFEVRRGRVVERVTLITEADTTGTAAGGEAVSELLEAALPQFYEEREIPPQIHLPAGLAEAEALEAWLGERAGRRVHLVVPQRGGKRALLELAARNASLAYQSRFNHERAAHYDGLDTLRVALGLAAFPRRIECFDISTIQGSDTVASMVVCEDGRMARSAYRKYRIRGEGARFLDDFAAMQQVVRRRYRSVLDSGADPPDLIVIDGGKGQLNAAYAALEELGLSNLVAVGLAKKEELVFTRDRDEPLALPPGSAALRLLQMIRDEAHRFAVAFHRQSRRSRDLASELDAVPGIGPRRRRALLAAFGSLAGVRRASREQLTPIVGARAADALLAHFAAR